MRDFHSRSEVVTERRRQTSANMHAHFEDPQVQDLVFSYLRLHDPALRRAALLAVRGLALDADWRRQREGASFLPDVRDRGP